MLKMHWILLINGISWVHTMKQRLQRKRISWRAKLQLLFRDGYGKSSIEPVAFKISVTFSIQFDLQIELEKENIQHERSYVNIHIKDQERFSKRIYRAFDVTLYDQWKQQVESMNSYSRFSFQRPFRDALIAGLEASKNFFHSILPFCCLMGREKISS